LFNIEETVNEYIIHTQSFAGVLLQHFQKEVAELAS
jgi:hypothetical protein